MFVSCYMQNFIRNLCALTEIRHVCCLCMQRHSSNNNNFNKNRNNRISYWFCGRMFAISPFWFYPMHLQCVRVCMFMRLYHQLILLTVLRTLLFWTWYSLQHNLYFQFFVVFFLQKMPYSSHYIIFHNQLITAAFKRRLYMNIITQWI